MTWRWWKRPAAGVPEPRHVRVHVVHEGRASGDYTVEGFEAVGAPAGWYWLDRSVLVDEERGRVVMEGGRWEVPVARIVGVEALVAVSLGAVVPA